MAPLPAYQRAYSGERYPSEAERQHVIRAEQYHYQPREPVARQTFEQRGRPAPMLQEPRRENKDQDRGTGNGNNGNARDQERGRDKPQ